MIQNREVKGAFESMPHLQSFLIQDKLVDYKLLNLRPDIKQDVPDLLTLFSEHSHVTSNLFTKDIIDVINQYQKHIGTYYYLFELV